MRIISGKLKSRQIKPVPGNNTRPTTDKNKENLFNMIGPYFDGGVCLDLFAGSGNLGIEAISRGIDFAYFIDKDFKAFETIKENINALKISEQTKVLKMDYKKALQLLRDASVKFDLVLLDPPYKLNIIHDIISFLEEHDMIKADGIIVCEDEKTQELQMDFETIHMIKEVNYGITNLYILRKDDE